MNSMYPRGVVDTLSGTVARERASAANIVFSTRRDPPIPLAQTPTFLSSPAAVHTAGGVLAMTTQPAGAALASPAWVNFQTTTTKRINFITFDVAFTSNPAAAGLVTLYVDESKRGVVDEPYALPGSQPFAMPTPGELALGQHVVSFRLDPFSALPSSTSIQNLATGWGGFVPFGDADMDGVVAFADITSVFANWGSSSPGSSGPGDANADGSVNFADITAVFANWGSTYP